jgi:hypothetical protein
MPWFCRASSLLFLTEIVVTTAAGLAYPADGCL